MKKHLSVLLLIARSRTGYVLGLMLLTAALQSAVFFVRLQALMANPGAGRFSPETLFESCHPMWTFAAAFVLLTFLLTRFGCEYGTKCGYTLSRLAIPEKQVFLWQSVYNGLCYWLFWVMEISLFYLLGRCLLARLDPSLYSNQSLFLLFCRNDFLHALLPLRDGLRWSKNLLSLPAMGMVTAGIPYRQRHGKPNFVGLVSLTLYLLISFTHDMDNYLADIVALFCLTLAIINHVWYAERRQLYEENSEETGYDYSESNNYGKSLD